MFLLWGDVSRKSSEGCAARWLVGPFDLVFADPPYATSPPSAAFAALRAGGAIGPQTLVVSSAVAIPALWAVGSQFMGLALHG